MFISLVTMVALLYMLKTTYICKTLYSFSQRECLTYKWACGDLAIVLSYLPTTFYSSPGVCGPRPWALKGYAKFLDTISWFIESDTSSTSCQALILSHIFTPSLWNSANLSALQRKNDGASKEKLQDANWEEKKVGAPQFQREVTQRHWKLSFKN